MMSVAHITGDPATLEETCLALRDTPLSHYTFERTIKMVPVVLGDYISVCPQQHEMGFSHIVCFYQALGQSGRRWEKSQRMELWVEWPSRPKQHLESLLRDLRSRKHIDQVEHVQYL